MNNSNNSSMIAENRHTRRPVVWFALIACKLSFVALVCAQDQPVAIGTQSQVTEIEGPNDVDEDALRFEAIDIFVDSATVPLAAYQLELASNTPGVEIVGIEGGEHAAFAEPPYYDSRAMHNNRVILAAFSTGEDLPNGRTRVARIHVQLQGPGVREYRTILSAAATSGGDEIVASLSVAKAKN